MSFAAIIAPLTRRRYYKECSQYGCTRVSAVDKNDLLEYLKGKREASAVVQLKLADDELGTESVNEPPAKRQKLEDGSALATKASASELSHEPMELTASDWAAREEFNKRLESKTREGDAGSKATLVNLAAETGLSLEKIEALKLKAKLKKKTPGDESAATVLDDDLREAPATANSYLTRSVAVVKDITSRERPMRTRASVLQLKGKEFKYILDTLHALTRQQKTARPDAKKAIDFAKKPAPSTELAPRYDRYNFNEDASFWKEKLKGDGKWSFTAR